MQRLIAGIEKFRGEVYPSHRGLFEELAGGQRPEALLVTCADSRIDPSLITQTKPGEIFICRNAGNIIPAYGDHTGGVTATIEFAVAGLGVRDLIVCGHTDCGAMKGILDPSKVASMPNVAVWLRHGDAARAMLDGTPGRLTAKAKLKLITEYNVLVQMQHVRTHPAVAAKLHTGDLRLHGWIYDIATGAVSSWNEESSRFEPVRGITPPSKLALSA